MKRKCQPEGAWPPLKRCRLHARKQCAYLLVLLRQRRPGEALPRVAPGCGSTKAVRIAAAAWGKDRCGYSLNRSVAGRHGARRALRTEVATLATAFRASRVHWHCSGRHSRASRSRHRCGGSSGAGSGGGRSSRRGGSSGRRLGRLNPEGEFRSCGRRIESWGLGLGLRALRLGVLKGVRG